MTPIPEEIRKKIGDELTPILQKYLNGESNLYDHSTECFNKGYLLAMQQVGEKDKEIERLKILVQEAFSEGATCAILVNQPLTKSWKEFKEKYLP